MRRFGRKAIAEAIRAAVKGQAATSIAITLSAADAMALADDIDLAGRMAERPSFEARVTGLIEGEAT